MNLASATVPDQAERLRFLQSPTAHRHHAGPAARVQTIETHMSWVFLVDEQVLKLKKPVRRAVLDFSTPALREFNCREELRLNARLAPGVYRGLKRLHWNGHSLALVDESPPPATGETLDWLVWMRRLPHERMLDARLAQGAVEPSAVDALAEVLMRFYRGAAVQTLAGAEYLARYVHEQSINRQVLTHPRFAGLDSVAALDAMDAALHLHAGLLRSRAEQGHVVEGHGDLRPEHICLLEPPVIIDALEFNLALRQVDPLDELAFLGMECEIAGAAGVGSQLVERYRQAIEPQAPGNLLTVYGAYRALLRARLGLAHLLEPDTRPPRPWQAIAQRYLSCAAARLLGLQARNQLA